MELLLVILYNLALLPLMAYNLGQLTLLIIYVSTGRQRQAIRLAPPETAYNSLPRVTVQLPVYNELYVVERLIDAIANLRYPADKLEIQVLDDSTDESSVLIARKVAHYRQQGIAIAHIQRLNRTGYKAGALAHGLTLARGEFIAIFDADFVPDPDFLLQTVPHFADPTIGMVQTRWTHLNENYSLLTQLQGFGLDAHFFVEQSARNGARLFMNFNGTAGIWRKKTIVDAGGWSTDTLTEDLDLSYRAQLRGWQFVYRQDIGSPAELPVTMDALRSQQYRWMKGAAECAVKLVRPLLTATNPSAFRKIHGFFHLISSSMFLLILLSSLLTVPVLAIRVHHPDWQPGYWLPDFFQVSMLIALCFYGIPFLQTSGCQRRPVNRLRFIWYFPLYVALMLGLSLHNTMAVIEGYLGRKTPFVRTPKFNLSRATDTWRGNIYQQRRVSPLVPFEGLLGLYFMGGIGLGFYLHDYRMLPFHGLLVIGFSLVFIYSLVQHQPGRPLPKQPRAQQPDALIETVV